MQTKNTKPVFSLSIGSSVKGAIYALIVSIFAVIAFAFIVKETEASESTIAIVNTIIKLAMIFLATVIATKNEDSMLVVKASIAGMLYIIASYLAFSFVNGECGDIKSFIFDLLLGLFAGAVSGLIFNNIPHKQPRKNKKYSKSR